MSSKEKFLILIILLLSGLFISSNAQVKITDGAVLTMNPNSLLELESTNKGLLIPRIAINNLALPAPLSSPVPTGMLVFSTGGSVPDGFYYWNGTVWTVVASGIISNYLPLSGGTLTGKLNTLMSSTTTAGLNLPHGVAPTAPVNGDIWTTTAGIYSRINGTTIGPLTNASATAFVQNGNSYASLATLGTNDNYALAFKTNNTEKMRIAANGDVAIGITTFDATNPEQLVVNAGTTTSVNAIYAKGTLNNYFQTNIQNLSSGTQASSDIVATANNGTETTNFMDIGINGSGYVYQSGNPIETGKANDCYLLAAGNDFLLVNNNAAKDMIFMTGGTAATNERMRITSTGTATYTGKLNTVMSSTTTAGLNLPHGVAPTAPVNGDIWTTTAGIYSRINGTTIGPLTNASANAFVQNGNSYGALATLGTNDNYVLAFETNNTEKMRIAANGDVAIGITTFDATNPEQLVVNAGTTTSVNAIYAKGTLNNYFQTNIQNLSSGTQASSDIVATANNGTETTNFMDMGINGSGYVYQSGNPIETGKANDCYIIAAGNDFNIVNNNAAKDIIFITGGTAAANERMRILSSGNVGIGITNPAAKLDVNGTFKLGAACPVLTGIIKTSVSVTDNTAFDYNTSRTETVTVTGAVVNAAVIVNPRTALPGTLGIGYSYVSASGVVKINITNSGNSIALGTVVFDVTIVQ